MDSYIVARFFQVSSRADINQRDFIEILAEAANLPHVDRERTIGGGLNVRIERFEERGDYVFGELNRIQTQNAPPFSTPDGLEAMQLAGGRGIGHMAAFQYHRPTRILLLQRNIQGVTPTRLATYVAALNPGSFFTFATLLRGDGWARVQQGNVRKLAIGFASPTDLALLEREGVSGMQSANELARTFRAPQIEIILSVGRSRRDHLDNDRSKGLIRRLLEPDVSLNTLDAKISLPNGVEDVDLLSEAMSIEQTMDLPEGSPDGNYQARKAFLNTGFSERIDYIIQHYGNRAHG